MIIILMVLWLLVCTAVIFSEVNTSLLVKGKNTVCSCSFLLLPFIVNTQINYDSILARLAATSAATLVYCLLVSSNHYIISLDILVFFSIILLILFNVLKIKENLSVKQSA